MKPYERLDSKICGSKKFEDVLAGEKRGCVYISFLNPYSYSVLSKNPKLIDVFDMYFVDGAFLQKMHNWIYRDNIERLSFDFSSVADLVFRSAGERKYSVGIVGAKETELELCLNNLKNKYKDVNIVYARNGYFSNDDERVECVNQLKESSPDIVIIGMGTPFQEDFVKLIRENSKNHRLVFTCGGFITQTSIRTDYYYSFVKKYGLRWMQRAIQEKHVRRRLLVDYPKFTLNYLLNHIRFR